VQFFELGIIPYQIAHQKMLDFIANANSQTLEEIWLLEHPSVFTLGQAGKSEHILNAGDIPVINTERGGQVTYHGPGQLVGYLLLNLKARKLSPRKLVTITEQIIIQLLAGYQITAITKENAPGVYVDAAKIASLGFRIRKGWSFHGFALNVQMDLEPFSRINPCGYAGLKMTQMADFVADIKMQQVIKSLKIIADQYLST